MLDYYNSIMSFTGSTFASQQPILNRVRLGYKVCHFSAGNSPMAAYHRVKSKVLTYHGQQRPT